MKHQPTRRKQGKGKPQQREPRAVLFSISVGSLTFHIELLKHGRYCETGPTFIVLIREDIKVQPYADEFAKAALCPKTLSGGPAEVELTTSRMTVPMLNQLRHQFALGERFSYVGFQYSASEEMSSYSSSNSQQQCIPPLYTENHEWTI